MKIANALPALLLCVAAFPVHGAVIGFEHIRNAADRIPLNQVAPGHGGVSWGADFFLMKSGAWSDGAHSRGRLGDWVLSSTAGENWIMPNIGGGSYSFDFAGGDFASLSKGGATFTLVGYKGGSETWSQRIQVGTRPQYFAFNWKETSGIVIYVNDGDQLILDNLRLTPAPGAPVPEPQSYALMGIGLSALLLRFALGPARNRA
ncbi:hypothetical protein GCM10011289_03010 [Paludibacterium paludis]|uniref:Ice-binding protein C-terminal domain-containing protein n=2 Tax=Paludibacterium paludis TaxID=1225769 RepID=A0A918NX42_9NEIS|nr:hypothetical protein GCM10011289_03010 [Paludibacterium paludis]